MKRLSIVCTIILLISLLGTLSAGCQQQSEVWLHQFGSGFDDIPYCIAIDAPGNIYIAGMTDQYALNIYTDKFLPKVWS